MASRQNVFVIHKEGHVKTFKRRQGKHEHSSRFAQNNKGETMKSNSKETTSKIPS